MAKAFDRRRKNGESGVFETDRPQPDGTAQIRETENGYWSYYQTEDGGTGYRFTPAKTEGAQSAKEHRGEREQRKKRRSTAIGALLTVALMGVCAVCGYAGTRIAAWGSEIPYSDRLTDTGRLPSIESGTPNRTGNGSAAGGYTTEAEVISGVSDSVVLLTAETYGKNLVGDTVLTKSVEGSGVIFSESGYILTNVGLIDGAAKIKVRLTDGSEFAANIIGYDGATDLAVVKINASDRSFRAAEFGCSSDLIAGEKVVVIGNPYGYGKLTASGLISAVDVTCDVPIGDGKKQSLIPVAVSVDSRASGSGLFNMDGKLVGMMSSVNREDGIRYAVPMDFAVGVIKELCEYGYVRGVVDHGLSLVDVTEETLNQCYHRFGISEVGVYVVSSKYSGEIWNKDRLLSVNGQQVNTREEFGKIVSGYAVGDTLELVVRRDGKDFRVKLVLREYIPAGIKVQET